MILLIAVIIALTLTGIGMLILAVYSAPEGFEDEMGFHHLR